MPNDLDCVNIGARTEARRLLVARLFVKEDDDGMIRLLATMLGICGAGLLAAAPLGAVPKPPPKFWSAARCERTMLSRAGTPRQAICIGIGGPSACRWTKGRARLYSEFRVFTRYEQLYVPAARSGQFDVVRALTLSTRARPGFARIVHHYGDDYARLARGLLHPPRHGAGNRRESSSVPPIGRSNCSAPEGSRVHELHRRLADSGRRITFPNLWRGPD